MYVYIYIYIARYEYIASTKMTPALREVMLCLFKARRFVASNYSKNVPRYSLTHSGKKTTMRDKRACKLWLVLDCGATPHVEGAPTRDGRSFSTRILQHFVRNQSLWVPGGAWSQG